MLGADLSRRKLMTSVINCLNINKATCQLVSSSSRSVSRSETALFTRRIVSDVRWPRWTVVPSSAALASPLATQSPTVWHAESAAIP